MWAQSHPGTTSSPCGQHPLEWATSCKLRATLEAIKQHGGQQLQRPGSAGSSFNGRAVRVAGGFVSHHQTSILHGLSPTREWAEPTYKFEGILESSEAKPKGNT
ncbi:hypothetical protein Dimus_008195, partial [Dionaea muscipula]